MRICLLGDGWFPDQPGGLNRYVRSLHESLLAAGFDVDTVVLGPASGAPPSVRVPAEASNPLLRRLRATARALPPAPDVLDIHFALYGLIPMFIGRGRGISTVAHFHGPWADESRVDTRSLVVIWAKRRVERAVYRRAELLVTLSGAFKRLLVERYGVSPWRVAVVPAGVDLARFAPGDRQAARLRWDVSDGVWMAVAVRRLVPRMGLDVLLEAWAQSQIEDGVLLIAGAGSEQRRLVALADTLAISDSVRFTGFVDDSELPTLYQAADVSVVPSRALEGFGLIVLESLASGTPVISTDVGGLPEVTAGLMPRLIVPAGDAPALAAQLVAAKTGAVPSREACRTHAESFTWERATARHIELYHQASSPSRSRLRVVYLGHSAELSGGELALLRLLPALASTVEAHVVLAEDGPLVSRLLAAGISVEVLPMNERARTTRRDSIGPRSFPSSAIYTLRVARRLRRLRPDLVHTNSLKAALYGSTAARLAGVPAIWHARDRIAPDYLPRAAVGAVRFAARTFPTAVVANSQATLDTLPGVRRGFVVPSPIELPSRAAGKDGGPLRVGMVGRVAPWKGQHVFVEAFARAFPDGDQEAVVVGAPLFGSDEEDYFEQIKQLGGRLGLGERLVFTGFRERVADELDGLDVLVHASTTPEPFGQVILEGMASGLAVVATAAGGPLELVADGHDGLLVEPGDSDALAAALRLLERDPELRASLGAAGRTKAAAYQPAAVAEALLTVYEAVLATG